MTTPETILLAVIRYRDANGNPTCAGCEFHRAEWKVCVFGDTAILKPDGDRVVPHAGCPVWKGANE